MGKERITERSENEKKYLTNRLNTIDGQVRGIIGMVENDRYCGDILIQIAAINSSLKGIGERLLTDYLANSYTNEFKKDKEKAISELMDLFHNLKL